MKLYLVDNYKVSTYSLPNKVEDAFIINYEHYTGKEEAITFIALNGKWAIQSSPDIQVTKDSAPITTDTVSDSTVYNIVCSDLNEPLTIYCFDTHQKLFDFEIPPTKAEITVGNAGNCDFVFDNSNMCNLEFKIIKQSNNWLLQSNKEANSMVYVNNRRTLNTVLHFGDTIFTNGLKLIWLDSSIRINNPNGKVSSSLSPIRDVEVNPNKNKYSKVRDIERNIVLYNDNQAFFHTPRMKDSIVEKEITIERPPQPNVSEELPAILSIGTTAVMGVSSLFSGLFALMKVSSGEDKLIDALPELILCLTMVIGAIILPILIEKYNKRIQNKREKNRKETYREYLTKTKNEIKTELEKEEQILNGNYLNIEQLQQMVTSNSNKIWNHEITDSDFLNVRLGIGTRTPAIKISFEALAYDIDKDVLNSEAEQLANEKLALNNVPITISLIENNVLPLVIADDYAYQKQFINSILLQLISYYSGKDLKIAVFTTKAETMQWEFLKYLPHCASDSRKTRFYAENDEEAKQLSQYLEKIYQDRMDKITQNNTDEDTESNQNINVENTEEIYKAFNTYYIIVTDNYIDSQKYGIMKKVLENSINPGFSLLTVEPTMQNVPSKCKNMIVVNNGSAGIVNKTLNENSDNNLFTPDLLSNDIIPLANIIGNIPLSTEASGNKLPKSLSFLDMYKVGKIEQLNILNRWVKNDPTVSISSPIGVHEDGKIFEIDLHEKAHGPHGLIAGSTGSGKSEFIITFILSMAINYHPYEVQFVLIDYKGGGLAGAFENKETGIKIPHLAGTITNLDVSEMNRTLVSIDSELKRRQRIFNEARDKLNESTIDIYKYQKFYREKKVDEPVSHLFIICDEFAELKSQQPDFMESLVSTARIGRSLGVHLILATQKPSGVVDDQIWSNARFKVCLKVATTEDSRELLRRPEAAEIKETGRFYLQVGFNELFELGQSAWSGAKYIPTDHIVKNIDDSIDIIDNTGNIIRSINDEKAESAENHTEQLTNIVQALYNIAIREKIKFQSMWLPSLPADIYVSDLIKKYNYKAKPYCIKPIVGEYDDPENQFQGEFDIDFVKNGNLLIYGLPGSGKENLIMTIIYSICMYHSSEEVNFYILDFGAQVIKTFSDMPQVGDVALIDDNDKIKSVLVMIDRELNRRRELFSEYGGTYEEYIRTSGQKLPMMFVVLNGYETFAETYASYVDIVGHLTRECAKYGIIFITTVLAPNTMLTATQQNFGNKITLQFSDPFDYKYVLNARDGLIPRKNFSRGLSVINDEAYEFQGAYIYAKDKINDIIKLTADKFKNQKKAPAIPIIPVTVNADTLAPYITNLSAVPLGINIHNAEICQYDFVKNKITQIIGNYIITETEFLMQLLKILSLLQDTKLKILDFAGIIADPSEFEDCAQDEFTDNIGKIITNEKTETKQMIYVIIGIGRIYDKVLDEGIEKLFKIFNSVESFTKSSFILIDNYSAFKKSMNEPWYSKIEPHTGVWVGADIENQTAIKCPNITKSDLNEDFNSIVYVSNNGSYTVLKGIGAEPEEDFE